MGFFGKLFNRSKRVGAAKKNTGNMQKDTGAGPAIAAHSKDAKATGKTGQNPSAAAKKR
jgi:hypothetical protein